MFGFLKKLLFGDNTGLCGERECKDKYEFIIKKIAEEKGIDMGTSSPVFCLFKRLGPFSEFTAVTCDRVIKKRGQNEIRVIRDELRIITNDTRNSIAVFEWRFECNDMSDLFFCSTIEQHIIKGEWKINGQVVE